MKKIALIISVIFMCFVAKAEYNKDIMIEPVLKTDTTSIGQKIIFPNSTNNEVTIYKITIPKGASTGWHKHETPVFAYVLKGNLTVELENDKTMRFPENSSFAEVINTFHNGVNQGSEDVILIVFFLGNKGEKLSIPRNNLTITK